MTKKCFLATVAVLALASAAAAQNTTTDTGTTQTMEPAITTTDPAAGTTASGAAAGSFIPAQDADQTLSDELLGARVVNDAGEELGTVSDLVIDGQGKVVGVVVGSGGFLGIGAKPVALPWEAVEVNAEQEELVVAMSAEEFANAPEFKTADEIEADRQAQTGTGMAPGSATTGTVGTGTTTTTQ